MDISSAPENLHYDSSALCYLEVSKDGIHKVDNSRYAFTRKAEDSLHQAYFRALNGDSVLYVALSDEYGETDVFRITDLDALADSIGILRPTTHVHDVRWRYHESDTGKGAYATIDISFHCDCTLSRLNSRVMVQQLQELFGWNVVLGSIDSFPKAERTIRVLRNSICTDEIWP